MTTSAIEIVGSAITIKKERSKDIIAKMKQRILRAITNKKSNTAIAILEKFIIG